MEDDLEPEIRIISPVEQLKDLTDRQLDEEKSICLDSMNPGLPEKLVYFHCNKSEYVDDEQEFSQMIVHFELESQVNYEKQEQKEVIVEAGAEKVDGEDGENVANEEAAEAELEDKKLSPTKEPPKKKTKLRNQFKYSERGCQTFNHPTRDRGVSTVPPSVATFTAQASRAAIYDTYLADFLTANEPMENVDKKPEKSSAPVENPLAIRTLHSDELKRAVRLMEYVVHHNAEYDIYNDFLKWTGDGKPELNHLWRIKSPDRRCVTSIQFNKQFTEMFAVGFGSYDFQRPLPGRVSICTIKNPKHPHFQFETSSGVMSMDFSTEHPSLLCVGFYNGKVAVYDIKKTKVEPLIYEVQSPEDYHTDPVWEVRWIAGEMAFLSISTDGAIIKWKLAKNELTKIPLLNLKRNEASEDDEGLLRAAQATTFDLNPVNTNQCLVGTEFGEILMYTLTDQNEAPKEFLGHESQVYAVRWSPFSSSTFLSASEDWTVKLWNADQTHPIITYDLVAPVGDIRWSPFSSTSFSAVTYDNKIHVFDISVNKNDASIHHVTNTKKYALTHIACAVDHPVLITGNKFGVLDIFKIPEHLTKHEEDREEETHRLENVLKITGTNVLDLKEMQLPTQLLS